MDNKTCEIHDLKKKVQEYIIQYTLNIFIYTMHERTLVKTKMSN